jgi:hypothetical protein
MRCLLHPTATLVAAALGLVTLPASASACAYHGGFQGGISATHPSAVDVASAIEAAEQAGTLESRSLAAPLASLVGYHRTVKQIERLRDQLSSADRRRSAPLAFSLLLIESALWSRFMPELTGIALNIHTPGPERGEPVVLTAAPVIRAVLDGRLSASEALNRGLIRVEAAIDEKLVLFELLAAAQRMH